MAFDINCDLGEGEPRARTTALMRVISSANVACGGHAGDLPSMRLCVELAGRFGTRLGAHPGPESRSDFGRGAIRISPDDLELLLLRQVSALQAVATGQGVRLHHIKLHGALYHAVESSRGLARRYLDSVARHWPRAKIYARAGGLVARLGRDANVGIWTEAFLDRAYLDDGSLVPRSAPNALLTTSREVQARLQTLQLRGEIVSVAGKPLPLHPKTLCLHSDTPHALHLARAISRLLRSGPA